MEPQVFIQSSKVNPWKSLTVQIDGVESICWLYDPWRFSSFHSRVKSLLESSVADFHDTVNQLKKICRENYSEFGLVLVSGERLVAFCDHIQSEPLYYVVQNDALFLSNTPDRLLPQFRPTLSIKDLREFALLNYTTGSSTILRGLRQLSAGEMLVWQDNKLNSYSYYAFWHYPPMEFDPKKASKEFQRIILEVVSEGLQAYSDYQIVLMLSGGLDSRLILWALDQLNVSNLLLCSYGRRYQRDVRWAERFAGLTDFPWQFIPLNYKSVRRVFQSSDRREYTAKSHYFSRVPFFQDFPALEFLKRRGVLNRPTLAITGNSGDYISGGHMPSTIQQPSNLDVVIQSILDKHYSCWSRENLTPAQHSAIQSKIRKVIANAPSQGRSGDNLYEWWEWRERQSKFVVGSKKLYQWKNLQLFLPLWDKRVMEFFQSVPFEYRQDQLFYRQFCHSLKTSGGNRFTEIPTTLLGKNVTKLRKIRRAVEYVANVNWGRYSVRDIGHMRWVVSYLLGSTKSFGFSSSIGFYNATILWDLIQKYPINTD